MEETPPKGELVNFNNQKPMIDQHQQAAEEVWNALPHSIREEMSHEDFLLGFKLGRVSMKACFDRAELLRADDEPKPFTQQN